jgi:hypothetical protein
VAAPKTSTPWPALKESISKLPTGAATGFLSAPFFWAKAGAETVIRTAAVMAASLMLRNLSSSKKETIGGKEQGGGIFNQVGRMDVDASVGGVCDTVKSLVRFVQRIEELRKGVAAVLRTRVPKAVVISTTRLRHPQLLRLHGYNARQREFLFT